MRIAIASDHGGFELKAALVALLSARTGDTFEDLGPTSKASQDYPDFAHALSKAILDGKFDRGILCCGSGVGMAIVANRHKGIRAVVCSDTYTARLSREHNDTNVLCLGERVIGIGLASDIVAIWLDTKTDTGERHARRRAKIEPPP